MYSQIYEYVIEKINKNDDNTKPDGDNDGKPEAAKTDKPSAVTTAVTSNAGEIKAM